MARYDNYPDDIRQYDHDPRSPFYEEPKPELEADPDLEINWVQSKYYDRVEDDLIDRAERIRERKYLQSIKNSG